MVDEGEVEEDEVDIIIEGASLQYLVFSIMLVLKIYMHIPMLLTLIRII